MSATSSPCITSTEHELGGRGGDTAQPAPSHAYVRVDQFGKDHWSLLAYVESCCVDGVKGVGTLNRTRMRANAKTHPLLSFHNAWKSSYGTRLKGFFDFENRHDARAAQAAGVQLPEHDDWDCLDDLEAAGYVETLSLANGFVAMTDMGRAVAAQLRAHKSTGGMFATFSLKKSTG